MLLHQDILHLVDDHQIVSGIGESSTSEVVHPGEFGMITRFEELGEEATVHRVLAHEIMQSA